MSKRQVEIYGMGEEPTTTGCFVRLVDAMGNDVSVVNAARVSFGKRVSEISDRDVRLIKFLARHKHWTPFSHVMVTLHIRMPIAIARQWYRHTVGFTRNEMSRRYVKTTPTFFMPKFWREADENVKQGSKSIPVEKNYEVNDIVMNFHQQARNLYDRLINEYKVCPEQARFILPQSLYTEFYETASLYAYARLYGLRANEDGSNHAQKEIEMYAKAVGEILRKIAPHSWSALVGEKHERNE